MTPCYQISVLHIYTLICTCQGHIPIMFFPSLNTSKYRLLDISVNGIAIAYRAIEFYYDFIYLCFALGSVNVVTFVRIETSLFFRFGHVVIFFFD